MLLCACASASFDEGACAHVDISVCSHSVLINMATRVLGCLLWRISVTLESFFIFALFVNVALCLCNDALWILDAKRTVEYESGHKCAHASVTNTYEEGAPLFFPISVRSSSAALLHLFVGD